MSRTRKKKSTHKARPRKLEKWETITEVQPGPLDSVAFQIVSDELAHKALPDVPEAGLMQSLEDYEARKEGREPKVLMVRPERAMPTTKPPRWADGRWRSNAIAPPPNWGNKGK